MVLSGEIHAFKYIIKYFDPINFVQKGLFLLELMGF